MHFDLSQVTPTLAVVVVAILCALDLLAGFVVSLKEHTTAVDKLPDWLKTNILVHLLPTVTLWLPQVMTPTGAIDSQVLAGLVYTAAITSAPKLVIDITNKAVEFFTGNSPNTSNQQ